MILKKHVYGAIFTNPSISGGTEGITRIFQMRKLKLKDVNDMPVVLPLVEESEFELGSSGFLSSKA